LRRRKETRQRLATECSQFPNPLASTDQLPAVRILGRTLFDMNDLEELTTRAA
jgi:hypothetical protein